MSKTLCSLLILFACLIPPLGATEYYVDSRNGSDEAAGTSESQAWQSLAKVNAVDFQPGDVVRFVRGGLWRGSLKPKSGTSDKPVTYTSYGTSDLPKPRFYGSKPLNRVTDWKKVESLLWRTVEPVTESTRLTYSDVGNLIFDGHRAGVKCRKKEQLETEGCFWFEPESRCVWLVSADNPAEICREIEAALRPYVIDLNNAHHVVFSDFDVRYGGSHGFGGSGNSHITIRHCDISWIGGGHQNIGTDGVPVDYVRFGNGIEFWSNAHDHLVENCRLWEIYDAALTNQGNGKNEQRNITYRNNVIWNCEYSFEYWNRNEESITDNIVFTHNTCFNAGYGWGHTQRPDPNGRHLMFYDTTATTTNFVVTHNVFAHATDSVLRIGNRQQTADFSLDDPNRHLLGVAWAKQLVMDHNVWHQQPGDDRILVLWRSKLFNDLEFHDFSEYQEKTGLDRNTVYQP